MATVKLQVRPNMYHLTCKCSSGRATAVNHAATAHLCRCAILKLWCASVLQISQAMQPTSVTSSRTPFQRVGVHRQQELTKAAEGAEALSSEVERLEAELHTATTAADSMVNPVSSCQHLVQLVVCGLITLLVESHVSIARLTTTSLADGLQIFVTGCLLHYSGPDFCRGAGNAAAAARGDATGGR